MTRHRQTILSLTLILLATILAYASVFSIPFLYYEEYGIAQNSVITDPSAFWERMVTLKGLFARPLSVLSYMIDYQIAGASSAYFHAVNLLIHCTNTILLFFLAGHFLKKARWLPTLLFALHPLATACVSQIHGRPASLATLFLLIALILYFRWQEGDGLSSKRGLLLFGLFGLMMISKQTLIFFPAILLWHQLHLNQGERWRGLKKALKSKTGLGLAAISLLLLFLLAKKYVLPNIDEAIVTPSTYFLSQLGNAQNLLKFYVFPFQTALVHDLYFHDGLDLQVFLGFGMVLFLMIYAFRKRETMIGFLLGAFLLSILPTNSFIPKNEVIREWRLYPSLVFLCLLFGVLAERIAREGRRKIVVYALLLFYIGGQGLSVFHQNRVYTDDVRTWEEVVKKYPYSSDSVSNIGVMYAQKEKYVKAINYFHKAIGLDPTNYTYYLNIASAYWRLGNMDQNAIYSKKGNEIAAQHNERRHSYHLAR